MKQDINCKTFLNFPQLDQLTTGNFKITKYEMGSESDIQGGRIFADMIFHISFNDGSSVVISGVGYTGLPVFDLLNYLANYSIFTPHEAFISSLHQHLIEHVVATVEDLKCS